MIFSIETNGTFEVSSYSFTEVLMLAYLYH